jgi:predicted ATP-binding protein involved in virulence
VKVLRLNFPKIQFIASSHSPFLIQEMAEGELIKLDNQSVRIGGGSEMSIEDIAERIQDMENPQWSDKRKALG